MLHVIGRFLLWVLVAWAVLLTVSIKLFGLQKGAYFAWCQLLSWCLFVVGLVVLGIACYKRAWTLSPNENSIKPLDNRKKVDDWDWPWLRALGFYSNFEDGVTGVYAYGPSWQGAFNPTASRWKAFEWAALRNPVNGFGYLTWIFASNPPLYGPKKYLGRFQIKMGWQSLPASDGWVGPYRERMVCSFW